MKRGSASLEYFFFFFFASSILVSVVAYLIDISNEEVTSVEYELADNIGNEIILKSQKVYHRGDGNWEKITIHIPNNIKNIEINNNELILNFHRKGGVNKFIYFSNIDIKASSSLNNVSKGKASFKIKSHGDFVCIGTTEAKCN